MNEFFQCTVCFENFDTKIKVPRLLPCQHSFCSICLPKLFINSNRYYEFYSYRNESSSLSHIECPVCRAKHYTKIEDVPKSRLILNLIEFTNGNLNNIKELVNLNTINRSNSPSTDNDVSPPSSPSPSSSSSSSPPNSTTSSINDLSVTPQVNQIPIISTPTIANNRNSSSNLRRILLSSSNDNNAYTTQITTTTTNRPASRVFVSNYPTYNRVNRESNLRSHYQYSSNNNNSYSSTSFIRTPRSHSVNTRSAETVSNNLNLSSSNSSLNTIINDRQTPVKRIPNRSTTQSNDNK
jgi:hypothetical protein